MDVEQYKLSELWLFNLAAVSKIAIFALSVILFLRTLFVQAGTATLLLLIFLLYLRNHGSFLITCIGLNYLLWLHFYRTPLLV